MARVRPTVGRVVATLLAGGALVCSLPAAASADRLIERDDPSGGVELGDVSGYGGVLLWQHFYGQGDALAAEDAGSLLRYRGRDRRTRFIPGAGGVYFGRADLGRGRRGGVAGVFSYCDEPMGYPQCDLRVFSVSGRGPRRLRAGSRPRVDETAPSIWRGRVAFTRAGRRGGLYRTGPLVRLSRLRPIDTDLRGSRVTFVVRRGDVYRLYVKRFNRRGRGRSCLIARGTVGRGPLSVALLSPVLTARHVYWLRRAVARRVAGKPAQTSIRRRRLPTRRCRPRGREQSSRAIGGPDSYVDSVAVDGGRFFYTATPGGLFEATNPFRR